jgi:hypothetical protein
MRKLRERVTRELLADPNHMIRLHDRVLQLAYLNGNTTKRVEVIEEDDGALFVEWTIEPMGTTGGDAA